MQTQLSQILAALSLDFSPTQQTKILQFLELLERWNQVYNLTAIRDAEEAMRKHVADSLAVVGFLIKHYAEPVNFLDVGSGGGLPGIPLAIALPDWRWTLLDSNGKKTRFLVQVKASLGLGNVEVVQARVEDYQPQQCFDGVITRAWTDLPNMLKQTQHLYCADGQLWAMKGVVPEEELALLGCSYEVYAVQVPLLSEERHLIRITVPHQSSPPP